MKGKKMGKLMVAVTAKSSPPKCWSPDWKDAKPSKYTPEGGMKAKDGK